MYLSPDDIAMYGVTRRQREAGETMNSEPRRMANAWASAVARRLDAAHHAALPRPLVPALLGVLCALFAIAPANAQQGNVPFVIQYTGTLKKINDSGVDPHRLSREFAAVCVPRRKAEADRLFARPVRDRRRGDRRGARQGHPGRVQAGDAGEPLRSRQLGRGRPRMRLDDEQRRAAQDRRRSRRRCSSPAPSCWCGAAAAS